MSALRLSQLLLPKRVPSQQFHAASGPGIVCSAVGAAARDSTPDARDLHSGMSLRSTVGRDQDDSGGTTAEGTTIAAISPLMQYRMSIFDSLSDDDFVRLGSCSAELGDVVCSVQNTQDPAAAEDEDVEQVVWHDCRSSGSSSGGGSGGGVYSSSSSSLRRTATIAGTDARAVLNYRLGLLLPAALQYAPLSTSLTDPNTSVEVVGLSGPVIMQPVTHHMLESLEAVSPVPMAAARRGFVDFNSSTSSRHMDASILPVLGSSTGSMHTPVTGCRWSEADVRKPVAHTDSTGCWPRKCRTAAALVDSTISIPTALNGQEPSDGGDSPRCRAARSHSATGRDSLLRSIRLRSSGSHVLQDRLHELEAEVAAAEASKVVILGQLGEMVEVYHSQQRELQEAEARQGALKVRDKIKG